MASASVNRKGLLARKVGMTQVFRGDGSVSAVTVLEAGPCQVLDVRTPEKHGYSAARVSFLDIPRKQVNKPRLGEFERAGQEPRRHLVEIRDFAVEPGGELRADLFGEGDLVDVSGTSKGKGFQGMVKRHGFSRGPETHGSMNVRRPGSIGATNAARVTKGLRMAGRMGAVRETVKALSVVRVDVDRNLLLVEGSVPGPRGGVVLIRDSIKRKAAKR
jgi:large subunit ribosomal protein L3